LVRAFGFGLSLVGSAAAFDPAQLRRSFSPICSNEAERHYNVHAFHVDRGGAAEKIKSLTPKG